MTPYYQDSAVTIYLGDCREILPILPQVDLVITDPPYGIDYRHSGGGKGRWHRINLQPIQGDKEPFDPRWLLQFPEIITWGANHYCRFLPATGRWLVWDKLAGMEQYDSFSDCEIAWHSEHGPERLFSVRWKGICRTEDEKQTIKYHPSQKPVSLIKWCIGQARSTGTIIDPYMGSGTTLRAAKDLGRKAIGIELEEKYAEIAARRMAQECLPLAEPIEQRCHVTPELPL